MTTPPSFSFNEAEFPMPFQTHHAEISVTTGEVASVITPDAKVTNYHLKGTSSPPTMVSTTLWGFQKPFEITLRADEIGVRGSLVVTNKTSGLNLPVEYAGPPEGAIMFSFKGPTGKKGGLLLLPMAPFPAEMLEMMMAALLQGFSKPIEQHDDSMLDQVFEVMHVVLLMFHDGQKLPPDSMLKFNSIAELRAHAAAYAAYRNLRAA